VLVVLLASCGPRHEEPRTVKVAAVQFVSEFGDPAANRRRLVERVREAAANGAKIVVLPEAAIPGYMSHDIRTTWQAPGWALTEGLAGVPPVVEAADGESVRVFGALARELGIYVTVPFVEEADGKFYNTVVLAGPGGGALHYRKRNPWPHAERGWASSGDALPTVETPYGRLATLVCFDIHREARELRGIDVLLWCVAWVERDGSWFEDRLPAVARENGYHVVAANWTIPARAGWEGHGRSRVVDRSGRVVATLGELGEGIVYAELPIR
jgi:predicted amidohydrolase